MPITAVFAATLTLMLIALSGLVIQRRMTTHTALGDGGDAALADRIRAQGNFAEYAPMALILLACAESLHAPAAALGIMGAVFCIGRISHAAGLLRRDLRLRQWGMIMTFGTLATLAAINLWRVVL